MKTSFVALLALGCIATLPLVPGSALACSDLPNICQQQLQVHQQNQDNAYIASEIYGAQQDEYLDSLNNGPAESPYAPAPDPMMERVDVAFGQMGSVVGQANDTLGHMATAFKDPTFKKYHTGFWQYFQDSKKPKPGEYCVAMFTSSRGVISLSGPGSNYNGAMLTFWGLDIPSPPAVRQIKVTLDQTDTPTQTVTAFNYAGPGGEGGALALAVPTVQAAMDGMVDEHNFKLTVDGKKVFDLTWNKGLAARDQLAACVKKYKG